MGSDDLQSRQASAALWRRASKRLRALRQQVLSANRHEFKQNKNYDSLIGKCEKDKELLSAPRWCVFSSYNLNHQTMLARPNGTLRDALKVFGRCGVAHRRRLVCEPESSSGDTSSTARSIPCARVGATGALGPVTHCPRPLGTSSSLWAE